MALPPIQPGTTLKLDSSRPALPQLKVGQQLTAQVTQRIDNSTYELLAGSRKLLATSSRPLQQGQTLQLQVTSTDRQQPVLLVRQSSSQIQQQQINQALRSSIPAQTSLKPLPADIASAARNPTTPSPVRQSATQVLQSALQLSGTVTDKAVQQAVTGSGNFMENSLLKNPSQLPGDLKANLARLVQSLQQSTAPQMKKGTQSSTPLLNSQSQPSPQNTATQTGSHDKRLTAEQLTYSKPMLQKATADTISKLDIQLNRQQLQNEQNVSRQLQPQPQTTTSSQQSTPASTAQLPLQQPAAHEKAVQQQTTAQTHQQEEITTQQQKQSLQLLLGKATGALHKIQTQQLQHLQSLVETTPSWHMSIPLQIDEQPSLMELMIQKEHREEGSDQDQTGDDWQFYLNLDLPELGPMQVNLGLTGKQLNTRFIVERPETQELLSTHLETLAKQLIDKGLEPNRLDCLLGEAVMPEPQPITDFLLSEHI